jgi:hypothetical protein
MPNNYTYTINYRMVSGREVAKRWGYVKEELRSFARLFLSWAMRRKVMSGATMHYHEFTDHTGSRTVAVSPGQTTSPACQPTPSTTKSRGTRRSARNKPR